MADLERALGLALRNAARAATVHPPFIAAAALPAGASASLGPSIELRHLDVGPVRIDATSLWPDEASEVDLPPRYAPLSLEQLIAAPPPAEAKKMWGRATTASSAGATLTLDPTRALRHMKMFG